MKIIIRYRDSASWSKMTVTDFPCSIGRAQGSTICLPHDSVSANHAVIEKRDGVYLIRDLESKNGIICDGNRLPSFALNPHTTISIGIIDIEVIELSVSMIEQTKSMMAPPRSGLSLSRSFAVLTIVPVIALLKTYYLGSVTISLALAGSLFSIGAAFAFSAFSAWISSFFDQSYKFKKSFSRIFWVIALIMAISSVIELFTPYFSFNLDDTEVWTMIRAGIAAIFIAAFTYFYCKEVFLKGYRRKLGITGTALTSLMGVFTLLAILSLPERAYLSGSITKPLRSFTRENRSLADFDAKMKASFEKIEKERAKAYEKAQAGEAESSK